MFPGSLFPVPLTAKSSVLTDMSVAICGKMMAVKAPNTKKIEK